MECTLQAGDEVVCISNDWPPKIARQLASSGGRLCSGLVMPEIGAAFHIQTIEPAQIDPEWSAAWVVLKEIGGQCPDCGYPVSFPARWFRPVAKTEISDLQQIVREVFDKPKVNA